MRQGNTVLQIAGSYKGLNLKVICLQKVQVSTDKGTS